jgi:uncharacterized protein DUF4920
MLALTLAAMFLSTPVTAEESGIARFGKPLKGLKATPLSEVLASPKDGATVRLEGKAETVCRNKGCWVTVRDGKASVHVTFEGYSFFVPRDSAGKKVALEGKVKVKAPDPAEVAHLKGEGAGTAAASRVSVEAYGVELRDGSTR